MANLKPGREEWRPERADWRPEDSSEAQDPNEGGIEAWEDKYVV